MKYSAFVSAEAKEMPLRPPARKPRCMCVHVHLCMRAYMNVYVSVCFSSPVQACTHHELTSPPQFPMPQGIVQLLSPLVLSLLCLQRAKFSRITSFSTLEREGYHLMSMLILTMNSQTCCQHWKRTQCVSGG